MPWKSTKKQASRARRSGKAPTTQAGAYVREQMHKAKRGKGRAKSREQAIAIGLSQARRSGARIPRKGASAKRRGGSTRSSTRPSGRSGRGRKTGRSSG
jgi:Family of unknown function (DUF6496)